MSRARDLANFTTPTLTVTGNLSAEGRSIVPLQKGGNLTGSYDLDTFPPNSVGYYAAGSNATNRGFSNNGMLMSVSTHFLDANDDNATDERAAQLYFGDTNNITTQAGGSTGGFWYRPKQGTTGYHRWGRVPISSMSNTVIQCMSTNYSGFASTTSQSGITFADLDMSPIHTDSYILVVAHVNGHSQDDSEANLEYNKTNTSGTETGWTRDDKLNGNGTRKCIGDFAWAHNSNNGNHHCATSILADFGTDMKRIRVRIRASAENNTQGGMFVNTGKGGNSTGGYNFDTAKCTLTMYEIARGGSGGVNLA